MRIGGFQKLTLVDFPGKVAATVFTQGCHFRCGFCHNPELVLPERFGDLLTPEEILSYLQHHRGKLEGVVLTGGEPTIQEGLSDFIVQIRAMGFAVKLDTNGSQPQVLAALIASHLIDYIAMDIKTSVGKYRGLTSMTCPIDKIIESINLIIDSGIPYQFRTTLVKEFCTTEDLTDIQHLLKKANHYVLQTFVPSPKMVDSRFNQQTQYTFAEIELLKARFQKTLIVK
ncbi:MAG: anaerobic ribonucleoside-triphosphate reductase activating protein [Candidatus Omnitrophica bacterium]|nr:anaerobic ribonucleoside-triphosphate reductase activating protein [Candidatus Omnitrophota bacterium]